MNIKWLKQNSFVYFVATSSVSCAATAAVAPSDKRSYTKQRKLYSTTIMGNYTHLIINLHFQLFVIHITPPDQLTHTNSQTHKHLTPPPPLRGDWVEANGYYTLSVHFKQSLLLLVLLFEIVVMYMSIYVCLNVLVQMFVYR